MSHLSRELFIAETYALLADERRTEISVSTILDACAAKKGSLYHFFPNGKDELILAVVEDMHQRAGGHIQSCIDKSKTTGHAVQRHVVDIAKTIEAKGPSKCVPISTVAIVFGSDNEEVRVACNDALDSFAQLYESKLKADGLSQQEARNLSKFIATSIEGAFVLSRSMRSSLPLRNAAKHLRSIVDDYLAPR
ncbi:MAG: TetR/AcrR family transcriptional regulator [Planctomycetota bacterium]